jgi:hypothetical protein
MTTYNGHALDAWLTANPSRAKGFHNKLGVTEVALGRYRRGLRFPVGVIEKIYAETGGAVDANCFFHKIVQALKNGTKNGTRKRAA